MLTRRFRLIIHTTFAIPKLDYFQFFFHFHTHGTRTMAASTPTDMPEEGKDEGVRKAVPGEDANVSGEDANVSGEDTNVPLRSRWTTAAECILKPKYLGRIIWSIILIVLSFIYTGLFGLFFFLIIVLWCAKDKKSDEDTGYAAGRMAASVGSGI
jgi:hypothetical protein